MKRTNILGSFLIVFLMLMIPTISSVENSYNKFEIKDIEKDNYEVYIISVGKVCNFTDEGDNITWVGINGISVLYNPGSDNLFNVMIGGHGLLLFNYSKIGILNRFFVCSLLTSRIPINYYS